MNARDALQALLDRLDYTRANCRLQDTVGDRLTPEMIADARMAVELQGGDASADDDAMLSVPVTTDFDSSKPTIGYLRVQRAALPPAPDFVFAIGCMMLDTQPNAPGTVPTREYVGRYRLTEVALVADAKYIGYLRQIGKLPAADDAGAKTADAVGKKESETPQ